MTKTFDKEIDFYIGGVKVGGTTISVDSGEIDTQAAEDEFYTILRKHEKSVIEEGNDYQKSYIIDHLTLPDEEKLKEEHAKDYHGTDDDMPDAYEYWLMELSLEELRKITNTGL